MSKTKPLLLSALVYPGLGQCCIKRYVTGIPIVAITSIALVFILVLLFSITGQVVDLVVAGELGADHASLRSAIYDQLYTYGFWPQTAIYAIILSWLAGVIDLAIFWKK